ncbi:MAG: glycosyltransferase family 4 protein [Phototrophicaceae bacterium]
MTYPKIRMTLFFTRGIRLQDWYNIGSVKREIAIYQKLRDYNVHTSFVTYGDRQDARIASDIMDIPVYPNFFNVNEKRYIHWLPWLHAPLLWRSDVIKTNQTNGADIALRAAQKWGKPFIARFGYMHSFNVAQNEGHDSASAKHARYLEETVFTQAQAVIGTTERLCNEVLERFPQATVYKVPNYVDTEHFAPLNIPKAVDITYVGRLHPEKNVQALLEAIEHQNVTCRIIGGGQQLEAFQARFGTLDGRLDFVGQVAQSDLPRYLNETRIFVMPSLYEGHPKAVIEAMSCGTAVIGTDVNGTREVINHGLTGWLCATDSDNIGAAIATLMADEALRQSIGKNARDYVLNNYNLDTIVEQEYHVIRDVMSMS